MQLSKTGIDFIKKEELLVTAAYQDAVGVWTIGYGHTGNVRPGQHITEQQAETLLLADTATAQQAVSSLVKQHLTQGQYDALTSFVFNVGVGAFGKSTLLKVVNGDPFSPTIAKEFSRWVFGTRGGERVILSALVNRRKRETALYFS